MSTSQIDQIEVVSRLEILQRRLAARRGVHHVAIGAADLAGTWTWTSAEGAADEQGRAMTPDTPWLIASITKSYLAALILRLYEQGHLDLRAPITTLLPTDLTDRLHVLDGVDHTSRITANHLLGHLSGLADGLIGRPRGGRSLVEQAIAEGDRTWSLAEVVAITRDHLHPHFPPSDPDADRVRIRYSDTNYVLLMLLAEAVSGRSLSTLYEEHLWTPLGLHNTWLPGERVPGIAPAAFWTGDEPFVGRPGALASARDLYATTDDLLRFGRALFTDEVFADAATGEMMRKRFHRFGLPKGVAALREPSWPIEYGLGIMRFDLPRVLAAGKRIPVVIGHTGSTGTWLWWLPEHSLVVAGTVDQTTGATVPFRTVPAALSGLSG